MATAPNVTPIKPPNNLAGAMARAFAEIEGATKSANNPHFKTKYADLTSVIEAIKPALTSNDLFFTQRPLPSENGVTIATFLHHASGEEMALGSLFVPANKMDAQGFGSALTYARRYALVTAFGVPVEDDDGNAAANSTNAAGGQRGGDARSAPGGNPSTANRDRGQMPPEPFAKIVGLIEATGTSAGWLCSHYGVANINQLNESQFADAVANMETVLAEKARSATNAKAGDKWAK